MNEHDTEVMAGIFMQLGYEPTDTVEDANVVLLNTCAIRENAENKVFGELGHLKHLKQKNPDVLIGVCGCMSQEESVVNKILKTYNQVDMIFGTHNIHRLPNILNEAYLSKEMVVEVWSKEGDVIENLPRVRKGILKHGSTLCMAAISSVHIVSFHIHVEKNVVVVQKISFKKFDILLLKDIKK